MSQGSFSVPGFVERPLGAAYHCWASDKADDSNRISEGKSLRGFIVQVLVSIYG